MIERAASEMPIGGPRWKIAAAASRIGRAEVLKRKSGNSKNILAGFGRDGPDNA